MHCQRPPSLDPLLCPLPPPLPIDLRLPWKAPFLDKMAPSLLLSPIHSIPHPLALFQHLRRHHSLITSERLQPSDVILPKTSPAMPMTSPLPALTPPAALQSFLPMPGVGAARGAVSGVEGERPCGGGGGGGAGGPPGLSPLMLSESSGPGTSPYGRKLFPCPQCRYTTDRRNNLKRHMLTMHQLSAKLLECCGVLFRTKAALREHALIFHYHGYTCFYCGRRFCRKALLKRHLSVHNGQKEFICNVCDYATSHKSNLERHRRVHVRQDGDPDPEGDLGHHEGPEPLSDDVKSNVSETNSNVDVSCDELSVCSDDEDEEINVHSD